MSAKTVDFPSVEASTDWEGLPCQAEDLDRPGKSRTNLHPQNVDPTSQGLQSGNERS
jgi:hypothetical protein